MTASELEAEIGGLYDAWFAAALSRDAAFFREVLADDWYYVDIAGTVRDREQYVDMLDLVPTDATMRMVEFTVRERGSAALVRGTYVVEAVLLDGRDVSSETQFTAAWERRPDGWRCLLHHATRTAPAEAVR
jgi:ketosteroid isomerase-like protein